MIVDSMKFKDDRCFTEDWSGFDEFKPINVTIDDSTYRGINHEIDTLAASKRLRKLCDCGLRLEKGSGSATYYANTVKAPVLNAKEQELHGKKQELDSKKQVLDGKSTELLVKSTELSPKSTELSTELRDRIVGVGRKSDRSALLQLVVDILTERHLSASELAKLLGRTQKHVRTEYLQPLLDDGRVVRSNPDKPTDPNQIYMAGNSNERPQ